MKILVVKLSSLGDIVLATPSFRALRARWPEAEITAAGERLVADFLRARGLSAGGFLAVHPFTCWQSKEWPLEGCLALWFRAAIFIGGDTGPMHVSAAPGVPVVAIFGPTLPEVSGPIDAGHRVIQASRPATHSAYRTSAGQEHMLAIGVEQVLRTVTDMLSALPGRLSA